MFHYRDNYDLRYITIATWQYNGVAPWEEICQWIRSTYPMGGWEHYNETIYFTNDVVYTGFLLRWA